MLLVVAAELPEAERDERDDDHGDEHVTSDPSRPQEHGGTLQKVDCRGRTRAQVVEEVDRGQARALGGLQL